MASGKNIAKRLQKFDSALELLKQIRDNVSKEEFQQQPFYSAAAERKLHIAIEALLDLGNRIISEAGFRQPGTYSDVITVLEENHVLPPELAKRVADLPKFRNILVHDYAEIDQDIIYKIISTQLHDLEDFRDALVKWLKI